ncbi:MAG: hypothetical protein ACFB50_08805 [Rubrobacteraceae bacterium]
MENSQGSGGETAAKFVVIAGLSAVLFIISLLITERFGEIPVDIDWKAFGLIFAIIALLPVGMPTWAAAVGAAVGEGILDFLEGYEPDDPFGFAGYVIGFAVAGYIFGNQEQPAWARLVIGSIVGAFVQWAIEGLGFLIIAPPGEAGIFGVTGVFAIYIVGLIGNTITHGVILGALLTVILVPLLKGRLEPALGYAPKGKETGSAEEA